MRRPGVPVAGKRVVLPLAVVGAAEVDRQLPRPLHGRAHRIAAPVVLLRHLPDQGAALAVGAVGTGLLPALSRHPVGRVQEGIAHLARQRRASRRQRPPARRFRQAGGQGHPRPAGAALRDTVLKPVQDRLPPVAVGLRRRVHRAVVAARPLQRLRRQVDQQDVVAVPGFQPAQRPRRLPPGPGRRHRARPRRSGRGLLQDEGLQPAPRRLDRARVRERFGAVDPLIRRDLRRRGRRAGHDGRARPGQQDRLEGIPCRMPSTNRHDAAFHAEPPFRLPKRPQPRGRRRRSRRAPAAATRSCVRARAAAPPGASRPPPRARAL